MHWTCGELKEAHSVPRFLLAVVGLSLQRAEQGCWARPEPSHDLALSCRDDEVGFGRRTFTNPVPSTRNTHG